MYILYRVFKTLVNKYIVYKYSKLTCYYVVTSQLLDELVKIKRNGDKAKFIDYILSHKYYLIDKKDPYIKKFMHGLRLYQSAIRHVPHSNCGGEKALQEIYNVVSEFGKSLNFMIESEGR